MEKYRLGKVGIVNKGIKKAVKIKMLGFKNVLLMLSVIIQ